MVKRIGTMMKSSWIMRFWAVISWTCIWPLRMMKAIVRRSAARSPEPLHRMRLLGVTSAVILMSVCGCGKGAQAHALWEVLVRPRSILVLVLVLALAFALLATPAL